MKIAILGTRGIPNNYGGYEQLAEYLSVGLVKKGHQVIVYNNSLHPFKGKEYEGVKIVRKYSPEKLIGSAANIIYDFLCLLDALKRKADIILECGYQSSAIGLYLAPISRSKIVTNMDGLDWKRSKWSYRVQKLTKWFEYLGVKKSHALIADNLGMKEYLKKEYNADSHYIAYGTNIPENYNASYLKNFNVTEDQYNILVARLEPENNIEIILDGYVNSKQEFPFIVVGNHSTKYGEFLKNKYKSSKNIKFIGGVYNQDKLNALRKFSKYYFHGHSVGGTNPSLLDAMACECAIIAHRNSFNKNVLGSNSLYFSNIEEVTFILDHKSNTFFFNKAKDENLKKIKHEYTWQKIVDDHELLFVNLLN